MAKISANVKQRADDIFKVATVGTRDTAEMLTALAMVAGFIVGNRARDKDDLQESAYLVGELVRHFAKSAADFTADLKSTG